MPPDIAMLTARVKGTVRVLGEFSKLREAEYSRSDYMQLLTSDLCACYGYNADLIELFLSLFSPAEAPGRNLTLTATPTLPLTLPLALSLTLPLALTRHSSSSRPTRPPDPSRCAPTPSRPAGASSRRR